MPIEILIVEDSRLIANILTGQIKAAFKRMGIAAEQLRFTVATNAGCGVTAVTLINEKYAKPDRCFHLAVLDGNLGKASEGAPQGPAVAEHLLATARSKQKAGVLSICTFTDDNEKLAEFTSADVPTNGANRWDKKIRGDVLASEDGSTGYLCQLIDEEVLAEAKAAAEPEESTPRERVCRDSLRTITKT